MSGKVIKLGRHPDLPEPWKKEQFPQAIGDCINLLVKRYKQRKKKEAEAELVAKGESALKEYMLAKFDKEMLRKASTKHGSVTLAEKDVPKVVDKEAFGKWVAANKAWDLIYGKAVEEAAKARWDDGVEIGGVEKFHKLSLNLTGVK